MFSCNACGEELETYYDGPTLRCKACPCGGGASNGDLDDRSDFQRDDDENDE